MRLLKEYTLDKRETMTNHGHNMAIIDLRNLSEPDYFSAQIRTARRFFRSETRKTEAEGYRVISGGLEICIPGYVINRRDFKYWAVEMVSSGRGSLLLNGKEFDLMPGSVYAYGPGIEHRIAADMGDPLEKYFVDIIYPASPPPTFSTLKDQLTANVLYSHAPESLRRTFEELTEYGRIHTTGSDDICSKLFEILLMKVLETSIDRSLSESTSFAAYRRCREIIENRFPELATIRSVADEANVDISYLCRLFKKFDVQSPYKLLTRLRMNHAAGMLVREGMSVKQVAMELGYEDPFTFSRRFKKTMGLSPRQFNENYRKGDAEGETII